MFSKQYIRCTEHQFRVIMGLAIYGSLIVNLELKSALRTKILFSEHRFRVKIGLKDLFGLKYLVYQTLLYRLF